MKIGGGAEPDYANLLDGLTDERQQGITIDVAYRYFTTSKRSFIVADTPGHEQYTRNMAVGASFADLAVLLVDASRGIQLQTWRHARICHMMGIRHYVFAVNKMDLIGFSESSFRTIQSELFSLCTQLGLENVQVIPVCAKGGDNIIANSKHMPWYDGQTILSCLESVDIRKGTDNTHFVMPVQRVCRPNAEYRGFEGEIASGRINVGDRIRAVQSKESANVKSILRAGDSVDTAGAEQAVSITLDREIDISRGDVLTNDAALGRSDNLHARIIWLEDEPLVKGQQYYLKIGTQTVPASIKEIYYQEDVQTGEHKDADGAEKNQIVYADIRTARRIVCAAFNELPELGRFLLINRLSNATSACGVVEEVIKGGKNLTYQATDITRSIRAESLSQKPVTIWMTGLSGSGKSTLANAAEIALHNAGRHTMLLDGDNVRMGLNRDLSFSGDDRGENIRRIAEVSKLMNDAGLIVLTAFISPYSADRKLAKEIIGEDSFFSVYVNTPLEICEGRDVKGLYKKARAGEIKEFTGISSPYEEPDNADFILDMSKYTPEEAAEKLLAKLRERLRDDND